MTLQFTIPSDSPHLRRSLKRGLARQVLLLAGTEQADHGLVFEALFRMSPNKRSMERAALKLRKMPGVVCSGISRGRVVVVLRNVSAMVTCKEGVEAFTEDAVVYTRVAISRDKRKTSTWTNRLTFCQHAVERFIQRGNCALGAGIVDILDAEALSLLTRFSEGELIQNDGDDYLPARDAGVWAGSEDATYPDPEWRIARKDACIPTFSARTFLGPDEMNPCVWLRWQNDPRISLAA